MVDLGLDLDFDKLCDICHRDDEYVDNKIIFCEACKIWVHQACYGVPTKPSGSWLCQPCRKGLKPKCELCSKHDGAFKPIKGFYNKWAHILCALFIPKANIQNHHKMEPITIKKIPKSQWNMECEVCQEKGVCIKCGKKSCTQTFHVTCGRLVGHRKEILDHENDDKIAIKVSTSMKRSKEFISLFSSVYRCIATNTRRQIEYLICNFYDSQLFLVHNKASGKRGNHFYLTTFNRFNYLGREIVHLANFGLEVIKITLSFVGGISSRFDNCTGNVFPFLD